MAIPKDVPPLKRSQFFCPACPEQESKGAFFFFVEAPFRENAEGDLVATCPQCGNEDCREPWYMANVRRCQGRQTGPVTSQGKDKCRMNGFSTGSSYASGAIPKVLPPAKPGKYPHCDGCHDMDECTSAVKDAEGTCRPVICHRQSEIFAKYRAAHLSGDPESLRLTAADVHARMHMVLDHCFKAVFDNGVFIESLLVSDGKVVKMEDGKNEDGSTKYANLLEKKINPAINEAIKILEKMGFSLADWTLTPKSKEAKAQLDGYLAGKAAASGMTMDDFISQHNKDMKDFHAALAKGNAAIQQDETLKEALAEEQEGKDRE